MRGKHHIKLNIDLDSVRAVIDREQRFVAAFFAFVEISDKRFKSGKEKKRMKNKKVKAMLSAVTLAAGGGICYAVKHGRRKKTGDTAVNKPVLHGEGLTEEKVREYLLCLFNLYDDSEFDDLAEFMQDEEGDPREYAADNYSGLLFPYIKNSMAAVMEMKGDDGKGEEPFCMTDELFYCPACMICRQTEEVFLDRFDLYRDNEISGIYLKTVTRRR